MFTAVLYGKYCFQRLDPSVAVTLGCVDLNTMFQRQGRPWEASVETCGFDQIAFSKLSVPSLSQMAD
ncbi:hypothetical protein RRG08_027895 [Elysia crispata]|uniref:Uncharacterized protein n=1 Tax=Elysia crispata TaxID=231223 RepID=A0AAE1A7B3_9GAST|nr:hypothetical protein RRG08_027895 [Elysia crispata]